MNSPYGILEYELCKFFHTTPTEIGRMRKKKPIDIYFIERCLYERLRTDKNRGSNNSDGVVTKDNDGVSHRNMSEIRRRILYGNK